MKENTKKKQLVSNYFQCPICYETFNIDNRFARVLQCGHTICQKCIYQIIGTNYEFRCPFCKANLGKLRVALTYRNYTLMNLMELNEIKHRTDQTGQLIYTISKQTLEQIVTELDKAPKGVTGLVIKRLRDDKNTTFDSDIVRSNKHSMRFFKLLVKFNKLKKFELWLKFSFHGFEEYLAETLYQLDHLESVKIVNAYDEYKMASDLISLVGNPKIVFDIQIRQWQQ